MIALWSLDRAKLMTLSILKILSFEWFESRSLNFWSWLWTIYGFFPKQNKFLWHQMQ